jgi:hypothetical protein
MAHRLLRAGIQYVQGFSVNVANRQTTRRESDGICGGETTYLLSDSSTTLDGQQPVRAGRGPAACGGRRRFANWARTRSPQAGALDEARNAMIRVSLLP